MAQQLIVRGLDYRPRFLRDLKSLSPEIQKLTKAAIDGLLKNPQPISLRLHCIDKNGDPKKFSIDVTSNHSHKISFHMEGDIAVLRRVDTHKEIDRLP